MADTTLAPDIVTDPDMLLGATRAIHEQISYRENLSGSNAGRLIEQLRLLLVDPHQARFVFGAPDSIILANANLYARAALESALEEVFEEKVRLELVLFDEAADSLTDLLAGLADLDPVDVAAPAVETGAEKPSLTGMGGVASSSPWIGSRRPAAVQAGGVRGEGSGLNQLQLSLLQSSLREVFTSPKRVVVVPGYLLRWIPYLGPLRTSIVVACFQAFYLSRGTTARADLAFDAPGPFLAAIAGIAESSLWRHLDDLELGWFLKKVPYQPGEKRWIRDVKAGLTKKRPTRFLFRSTSPLTPGDAEALRTYLADLEVREDPLRVLAELVRGEYRVEPRDIFPFPAPLPPENWQEGDPNSCLIHNIIYSAIGVEQKSASKELASLVDELVERLLPSNDQLHIPWYYLLHWLPLLGHGPGWATLLLRDRCYYNRQTGELRDTVSVRGGYGELATALGLQRLKTVREWFPAPGVQKEELKSADLSSAESLEKIAQSKRSFVREYAASFVEITEAEADGRGQVSSFKAQVKLFDPLVPVHEAVYNALYPLAQGYFSLPQEDRAAFLKAFEAASVMEARQIERIIQESTRAAEEINRRRRLSFQSDHPGDLDLATADFLDAIERITRDDPGANQSFTRSDPGAKERFTPGDPGAFGGLPASDLGGFERIAALVSGAFGRIEEGDLGAFESLGLVFWAHMRGLKHLVLNNRLDEALKEYFQNTEPQNTQKPTSTTTASERSQEGGGVEVAPGIQKWDLNQLLNSFSPHVKGDLLEKGVTVEAVLSCLLYIASSKGDNLGLGYVVEKLKAQPQDGQGGIYRRLVGSPPEEIIDRLDSYLEYRSFRNRDWRVAMGTPSEEKVLELLEYLGLDSSQFGGRLG